MLRHLNVGEIVAAHKCYEGRDEALDTFVLDEDKLLDALEPMLDDARRSGQGIVMDYHSCEFFPERYFDLVLVLQCTTDVLFDRLTQNLTAEIMQVVLEEARHSYDPNIVHAVPSNTIEDMDSNVERVKIWMDQWMMRDDRGAAAEGSSGEDDDEDDEEDDIST
jgi:adenylate kinase